jgi:methyltransferase-like protein
LHEHLEEFNEALYFHQFVQRCADRGLQYVGEAQVSAMFAGKFGAEAENILRRISPDLLHMEQYMDFLRNRMFRQTLVCHADVKLEHTLRTDAIADFCVASPLKAVSAKPDLESDKEEEFRGSSKASLLSRDPLMKSAMVCLGEKWPLPIRFGDLIFAARARIGGEQRESDAKDLSTRLLNCYASGLVEFSLSRPGFTTEISRRPMASPYARLRARQAKADDTKGATKIINCRLESMMLGEPSRLVLANLDGEHDVEALAGIVVEWMQKNAPAPRASAASAAAAPLSERARQYVSRLVRGFASSALLIA